MGKVMEDTFGPLADTIITTGIQPPPEKPRVLKGRSFSVQQYLNGGFTVTRFGEGSECFAAVGDKEAFLKFLEENL